jgi:hypothetical protein
MVNPIRLQNYLQTLQISPALCKEFPDEAFGACVGLVYYAYLVPNARHAWLAAITAPSVPTSATGRLSGAKKREFYTALLHRKNAVFGFSETPAAKGVIDVAAYPWVLDDKSFESMKARVMSPNGLSEEQVSWDDLIKSSGIGTPLAAMIGFYIRKLVETRVPQLLCLLSEEVTIPVVGGLFTIFLMSNWFLRLQKVADRQTFSVDDARRKFDKTVPLGLEERR